ncbi:MAG: glycosyltransferase [Solirubrobacterales bacterium]|nr:glycosyltransferase [Solirubrobacterales bacterium]
MGAQSESQDGVSLIVTVRDDPRGLAELLGALAEQSEMPEEIVIVDGGTGAGTREEVQRWEQHLPPARVVAAPGSNIATGRNIAVEAAAHDWIACTDAGCRPVAGWLAALKQARGRADIAAGTFVVEGDTPLDRAVACAHYPAIEELHDDDPLVALSHRLFGRDFRAVHAGGRSMAFSRAAWKDAGGFPEHVYAGEDLAFSAAAIARGFEPTLVEEAVVRWRPRATWAENARMFATYTRGDVRTEGRGRHLARLAAWTLGPALMVKGGLAGRTLVAAGAGAYLWLPLRRGRRRLSTGELWRIPALVALKDLSQLAGAAMGVADAARGVPQPSPHR